MDEVPNEFTNRVVKALSAVYKIDVKGIPPSRIPRLKEMYKELNGGINEMTDAQIAERYLQ